MRREVKVTIRNTSRAERGFVQEAPIVYTVPGTLESAGEEYLLRLEEPAENGMAGVFTSYAVYPGRVELGRSGALTMALTFAPDTLSETMYTLGEGSIRLAVRTDSLRTKLSARGGLIELRYRLWLDGVPAGEKQVKLRIETME